ncbi:MAG: DUF2231 domain-containing protein [Ktedonobacterales bacterium]|nr:DUF2231 domain-containing protein [Ktedonobacterales bacterium]
MKDPIVRGHPIHAVLTDVPIGALVGAVVFDALGLITRGDQWGFAAQATVGVALVGGIGAALVGLWDYQAVPRDSPTRSMGARHGILNTVVLVLLAASFGLRYGVGMVPALGQVASLLGLALVGYTGWLGSQMVYDQGWRVKPAEYDEQIEASLRQAGNTATIEQAHTTVEQYAREHDLLPHTR